MGERMLDKNNTPSKVEILKYIGNDAKILLDKFDEMFAKQYDMQKELKFPFGNNYGWGYKYSHKTKHLCYVFFEHGEIDVLLQISSKNKEKLNELISQGLTMTKELWENRYPCSDGGWINYRPKTEADIKEIMRLLAFKKKPAAKYHC
ncbi:DUF3788 family protein [Clostridium oryzae]|uniref:DUF3788 domain-containing protein n=1 Tax=Clostridium oryzae TaxID=1450648 RepID=A0A1V4IVE7_9CLOT|nr:DUF3788 family protein [Clostridium oryzae]OPJ63800.1 hypothetical protein CLORY_09840 [Clostridium oryzae]